MNSIFEIFCHWHRHRAINFSHCRAHEGSAHFTNNLKAKKILTKVSSIQVTLYGSLASTGKGHATDQAVIFGLLGYQPESIDVDEARL